MLRGGLKEALPRSRALLTLGYIAVHFLGVRDV